MLRFGIGLRIAPDFEMFQVKTSNKKTREKKTREGFACFVPHQNVFLDVLKSQSMLAARHAHQDSAA